MVQHLLVALGGFADAVDYIGELIGVELVAEGNNVLLKCLEELDGPVLTLGIGRNDIRDTLRVADLPGLPRVQLLDEGELQIGEEVIVVVEDGLTLGDLLIGVQDV